MENVLVETLYKTYELNENDYFFKTMIKTQSYKAMQQSRAKRALVASRKSREP